MDQITKDIFISDFYTASNIRELLQNDIKTVVYIGTKPKERFVEEDYENAGIRSFWWHCEDDMYSDISVFFPLVLKVMEMMPKPVLFHCYAGVSRSASLVIAYLMYDLKISFLDAYRRVKHQRQQIAPNLNFRNHLYKWERSIFLPQ